MRFQHVVSNVHLACRILPKMNNQLITCEKCLVTLITPVALVRRVHWFKVSPSRMFGQILLGNKSRPALITHARFICGTDMYLHVFHQFRLRVEHLITAVKITARLVAGVFFLNFFFLEVTRMLVPPKMTFNKQSEQREIQDQPMKQSDRIVR